MSGNINWSQVKIHVLLLVLIYIIGTTGCSPTESVVQLATPNKVTEGFATVSTTTAVHEVVENETSIPQTPLPSAESTPNSDSVSPLISTYTPIITDSFPIEPLLVAPFVPDTEWRSQTPDNVWWSDDSQTLFYQDELAQRAWKYDFQNGITETVPYTARSWPELTSKTLSSLPESSRLYAISPRQRHILFVTPLVKPIPLEPPIFEDVNLNPQFSGELWLLEKGQTHRLGLVDTCFLLHPPSWSLAENKAIVNTLFTPDVERACMFKIWLIDLNSLKVGSLPVAFKTEKDYIALDLSPEGDRVLISETGRNGTQYIVNLETGEQLLVPNSIGGNLLVESEAEFATLGRTVEFNGTNEYKTHIWYSLLSMPDPILLTTLDGLVSQWLFSPNQKFIVYVVSPQDAYRGFDENIKSGIWLVRLP